MPSAFTEAALTYIRAGFHLVPLEGKRPIGNGWYLPDRLVSDEVKARKVFGGDAPPNIGVHLAASGLAEIDVDDEAGTRKVLRAAGLDLDDLAASGWAIRGRGLRIMFAAPEGVSLPFHRLTIPDPTPDSPRRRKVIFELRASATNIQSVLPPSIHPDTGRPYTALTPFPRDLPEVPTDLLNFWDGFPEAVPDMMRVLGVVGQDRAGTETPNPGHLPFHSACRELFNAEYSVEEVLERNGYERVGKRWKHEDSVGNAGVSPVPKCEGLWMCFDLSDPLAVGSGLFDAWVAYVILEHGGNRQEAEAALPNEMIQEAYGAIGFKPIPMEERKKREERRVERVKAKVTEQLNEFDRAFISLDGVLAIEPPDYIMRPLLPTSSITLMTATRNSGKTALAIGVALAVATGKKVGGLDVTKGRDGLVFYFAAEDMVGVCRRFRAQAEVMGMTGKAALKKAGVFIGGLPASLGDAVSTEAVAWFIRRQEEAMKRPCRLIIFDTGSRNLDAAVDENKAADVANVYRSLTMLIESFEGCAVLALVHPGHAAPGRVRGSSAWEGSADTVCSLEATKTPALATLGAEEKERREKKGTPLPTGVMRTISWTKMRNDALPPLHTVRFARYTGKDWLNAYGPDGELLNEGSSILLDQVHNTEKHPFKPVAEAEKKGATERPAEGKKAAPEEEGDDTSGASEAGVKERDAQVLFLFARHGAAATQRDLADKMKLPWASFQRSRDRLVKMGLIRLREGKVYVTKLGKAKVLN